MKRILVLTLIFSISLSHPCYAKGYSEETKRLMQEAGLGQEHSLEDILSRQEALKSGQTNNSTPVTQNGQNKANKPVTRRIKGGVDEYRIVAGGGNGSTQITDTNDGLHIYSNDYANGYNNAYYGSKQSTDEFHTTPYDIKANDGYNESTWGELHINENYRKNVYYEPERDKYRLGIDEYRLPWMMN